MVPDRSLSHRGTLIDRYHLLARLTWNSRPGSDPLAVAAGPERPERGGPEGPKVAAGGAGLAAGTVGTSGASLEAALVAQWRASKG